MRSSLLDKHYDFMTRETRTSSAVARIVSVSELRELLWQRSNSWHHLGVNVHLTPTS